MMPNYENAEPRQAASSYQYCAQRFVHVALSSITEIYGGSERH